MTDSLFKKSDTKRTTPIFEAVCYKYLLSSENYKTLVSAFNLE